VKALVFGCGPAGLLAAHAFAIGGHDVLILSKKRKSEMYGAQYLHAPIPGMTEDPGRVITYRLDGTPDQYRAKVYGPQSRVQVSPEDLAGQHLGYDIRRTYDNLWDTYGDYVQPYDVTPASVAAAVKDLNPDVTVSSVPAPALCCHDEHTFTSEQVWAIGDAPERGVFCPVKVPKETVVCNGEPSPAWYRAANVFGRSTAEWPHKTKPPIEGVSEVTKPVRTTCDCLPNVVRVGRYGKWQKGVLSHEAFRDVLGLLGG
jgi:hypothetical protein